MTGVLFYAYIFVFVSGSVSAVELQAHTELDPDADGMFTEEEAQVRPLPTRSTSDGSTPYQFIVEPYCCSFKMSLREDFLRFRGCWEEWKPWTLQRLKPFGAASKKNISLR